MIRVENIDVWGFEHAVRSCRNPMNSWAKSDSRLIRKTNVRRGYGTHENFELVEIIPEMYVREGADYKEPAWFSDPYVIGEKDLDLMRRLFKSGVEHRTYARTIQVSMDIIAPLYWWKEMDRYTVGKSQVSCSTMHTIHKKPFELDDFSHDHLTSGGLTCLNGIIERLNVSRKFFEVLDGEEAKPYWWDMIQILPSSYNQRRTVCMSYEVVFKIIKERTGHKLDEWNDFIKVLKELPYVKEIIEGV